MPDTDNQGLSPEDSLLDPDLGFSDIEMDIMSDLEGPAVHDVSIQPENEPPTLSEDANVPLDVEPDPEIHSDNGFEPELSMSNNLFSDDEELAAKTEVEVATEAINHQAAQAKKQTQRLTVEKQGLSAELESIREENSLLRRQLAQATDATAALPQEAEFQATKEALVEAKNQCNAAEEQAKSLRAELESMRAESAQDKAELDAIKASQPDEDEQKKIDLMDAQIGSIQAENVQLQEAMKEAQQAESRTEHAHDQLDLSVKDLRQKLDLESASLAESKTEIEVVVTANEELSRKLAVAEKELADNRDVTADVDRKSAEFADHNAELERVTKALSGAVADNEKLKGVQAEIDSLKGVTEELSVLKAELEEKSKRVANLQEKLDTEAARSYRLSQRRIPALNTELENSHEAVRELEAKLQKSELKSRTLDERFQDEKTRTSNLQRALEGAKARAHDTQMISAPSNSPDNQDTTQLAEDELRRVTNRLHEVESERSQFADRFQEVTQAHSSDLAKTSARADRLEVESADRFETLLSQRTDLRLLREKVTGLIKLAEELSNSVANERGVIMSSMRKIAVLPEEMQ